MINHRLGYVGLGILVLATGSLIGGSRAGRPLHPLEGRLVWGGGDVASLAGHHVELTQEGDHGIRASGVVGPDGRFRVEYLERDRVRDGIPAGRYAARLILIEEGDARPRPRVPKRYLDRKHSGWSVAIPEGDRVTWELKNR